MASIRKRGEYSYEIIVSCGYKDDKKVTKSKTIKLDKCLTKKQVEKELQKQVVLFEREVQNGTYLDGEKITFAEFTKRWLTEYAEVELRPKTVARYKSLLNRILPAIGHIRLVKLQPTHLMEFYKNLAEDGVRMDYRCKLKEDQKSKLSNVKKISKLSGINERTIKGIINGNQAGKKSADKICSALGIPFEKLFNVIDGDKGLSGKTINHHHKLISAILTSAVQWQLILNNPADRVKAPKIERKEASHYNIEDVGQMMDLLESEPIKYRVMIHIVICCGLRLGELANLEWSDINFDDWTIDISKQLQYLSGKGIYEVPSAKSESGNRNISIPESLVVLLKEYREWQLAQKERQGNKWVECNKLFTKENGMPIFPDTPSQWFRKFRIKNNLPDLPFHGLRHTSASLLIAQGVDVSTVSKRLGHADKTVTLRTYTHAIKEYDREAANKIDDILNKRKREENPNKDV